MFDPSLPRGGEQNIPRPQQWRPTRFAPWVTASDPAPHHDAWSVDRVLSSIAEVKPKVAQSWIADQQLREAAVLVGVVDGDSGAELILTRRSSRMRTHKGEIAFPGGRLDDGETPIQGALRESVEEIGLPSHLVTPVGELDHVATVVSGSYVVPVVASVETHVHLTPASEEVEKVLYVPVRELLHPVTFHAEEWNTDFGLIEVLFFEIPGETVFGATARMLYQIMGLVTNSI